MAADLNPPPQYPHWWCRTHGRFDAYVAVACPECMREIRESIRALRDSLRSGYLFGWFDEPLDDAGTRIVRAMVDRLEMIGATRVIDTGTPPETED